MIISHSHGSDRQSRGWQILIARKKCIISPSLAVANRSTLYPQYHHMLIAGQRKNPGLLDFVLFSQILNAKDPPHLEAVVYQNACLFSVCLHFSGPAYSVIRREHTRVRFYSAMPINVKEALPDQIW